MKLLLAALIALAVSSPVIAAQSQNADTVAPKQIKVKVTPGISMF
jgi:hypothetical protein